MDCSHSSRVTKKEQVLEVTCNRYFITNKTKTKV